MEKNDIYITCPCGEVFIWTAREQEFYEKNNYAQPKRCKKCRAVRAKERLQFNQK